MRLLFFLFLSLPVFAEDIHKLNSAVEKLQPAQNLLYKTLVVELRCPTCIGLSVGKGGSLFAHSALASEESLVQMQNSLLTNYLKCEEQFSNEQIRQREWEQRQNFLTNRYLDVTRRLDALRFQKGAHDEN